MTRALLRLKSNFLSRTHPYKVNTYGYEPSLNLGSVNTIDVFSSPEMASPQIVTLVVLGDVKELLL